MKQTADSPAGGEWWTAPAEADDGRTILVTGRRDVAKYRANPRFNVRYTIAWPYEGDLSGMPSDDLAEQMEAVQDLLQAELRKDPVAVLTGIFTGDGIREWVLYTLSVNILTRKLNELLAHLPVFPLQLSAEADPDWLGYDEMAAAEVKFD